MSWRQLRKVLERVRLSYLLGSVLIIFGALYLRESTYRDLWANLFAAVIAVLLIDLFIVKRSELQKSARSRNYARLTVLYTCLAVLRQMETPKSWREDLEKGELQWCERYKDQISTAMSNVGFAFEMLLGSVGHLLDAELQNDIFDILTIMMAFYGPVEETLGLDERNKYDMLSTISTSVTVVLNQAANIIKEYKLLESLRVRLSYKAGIPSQLVHGTVGIIPAMSQSNILRFQAIVRDAVEFRDRCQEKAQERRIQA